MNTLEMEMFADVLKTMEKHQKKHPAFYNNNNIKFIHKDEFSISNNASKGIILLEHEDNFIIDIYIDNGVDDILRGLLNIVCSTKEQAEIQYSYYLEYLTKTNLKNILIKGKKAYKF